MSATNASTDCEMGMIHDPPPLEASKKRDENDPNIVTWDSPDDPENPLNWPFWLRWTLISTVSALNFMTGLSSSMFAPSIPMLLVDFNSTNPILGTLVVTIFVLGLATGPLLFAPLSELYGRAPVQHGGSIGFVIFSIACAVSPSLSTLIGMRLLLGMFASVPLTNGGGIIADTVKQEERGFALAIYTMGTLLGPVVGPVAGGFLAAEKGWRWIFWVITMATGFLTCLGLTVWHESYAPVILERKAARLRIETGNMALRTMYDQGLSAQTYFLRGINRPLKMLVFSPILAALCVHMGLSYAYFYLLFTTFTNIFSETYHWAPRLVGLSFLGVGCGFIVGQYLFGHLSDTILKKLARKGNGELMPEYRLPLGCLGGIAIPAGFFWYGWSAEAKIHWIVPLLGTALIGFGNCLVFVGIQAYTIDAFTLYAASGLAANCVVRSIMAAVLPLAAPKMYEVLGLGWGNSLLAFLALAIVPVPVLLFFYGERMRGWNSARLNNL